MSNISSAFLKPYRPETAIPRARIVKFGAADGTCRLASAATDLAFGVSSEIDVVVGEPCDVAIMGLVPVTYGGNVTRGDLLTSDAQGRAVTAAPAAGTNAEVIGRAMLSGVVGDIGTVNLSPARVRG